MKQITDLYAIVPAGGAGTRLWPLSRAGRPKFLLDLLGTGRTLLQATVDRLAPLVAGTLVVTGEPHAAAVREQLAGMGVDDVLAEPSPRDSMAAIGLAAAVLAERHGDVLVGSFAADHVVAGDFAGALEQAAVAARAGHVVTIGIAPRGPSTAFGYIHAGEPLGLDGAPSARAVLGFTEKPDETTAARYLATGDFRWNAGIFVARASVLLRHLAEQRPALHDGVREIARAWDTPERGAVLDRVWPGLERIAIDHAIAEPVAAAGGVAVVPGDFAWDDLGDFAALAAHLADDDAAAAPGEATKGADDDVRGPGRAADVLAVDAQRPLVLGADRTVAVVGIDDVVVVQTPDAILVTTRERAQEVKDVVALAREQGRADLV